MTTGSSEDAAPSPSPAVSTSAAGSRDEMVRGLGGALLAVTAWSTGTILAKYLDMGALAIGFYRFATFFVLILVWMRLRGVVIRLGLVRDSMWGGVALGADIAFFFSAVKETTVVNATIIGSLQPIVVGVVAARFFGERIRARDALWAVVALVGVFVVVTSGADGGERSLRGDLLAVGAMLAWSGYFIASKQSRDRMTSTEFTAGTSLWTAAICLPLGLAVGQDMSMPNASNWAWLAVMILGSGIVGHLLMNWSLQRIPLWVGSTFTLFIPVASALMAWVVFDESISAVQAVAMAAVIGSLAMIVRGQTSRDRSSRPDPDRPEAGSPARSTSGTEAGSPPT